MDSNNLLSFVPTGFSETIFKERYAFTPEETWEEACQRVALQMAKAEVPEKQKTYEKKFKEIIQANLFVPGGRILYNSGRNNPQLLNCFVLSNDLDSKEGWGNIAKEMIVTSMTGGGCGIDFSDVRPNGSPIFGQKGECPGPVSLMQLIDNCASPVKAGGQRRVALMFSLDLNHPDVEEFLDAKLTKGKLTHANVSVKCHNTKEFIKAVKNDGDWELSWKGKFKKTVKAKDIWDKIVKNTYNSAEPGFLNWELMESENNIAYVTELATTNPCLSGNTKIFLADGRKGITIKQLAEEGKDVPVFCYDENKNVVVRYMRNPRITGYNQKIYKITLDDGSYVRTTENHKFFTKENEYKTVSDLKIGDGLKTVTKFKASFKEILKHSNSNGQDYWWVASGQRKNVGEHRLIGEFFNNTKIIDGYVVHHKDYNAANNCPDNLQVMTKEAHDYLHSFDMVGDKNPMVRAQTEWSEEKWENYRQKQSMNNFGEKNKKYSGYTNEQLREHAIILTKKLQKRFSKDDWEKYAKEIGLPIEFSKWRKDHLGGVIGLSKWAALQVDLDDEIKNNIDLDPRTIDLYKKALNEEYDAFINSEEKCVFVSKCCEGCGDKFTTKYATKEIGFCSRSCFMKTRMKDKDSLKISLEKKKISHSKKNNVLLENQINCFNDLKFSLKREPWKKEWQKYCKNLNVSTEIGRMSSPCKSWEELKTVSSNYNHRIVSIEFDGYEDVYNGTVDEFHNFFIGEFESLTKSGKEKLKYINNLQCGEIGLEKYGNCCLGHIVLSRFVVGNDINWNLLGNTIRTAVRFLDNVLTVNSYPLPEMKETANKHRRIGLGTTALADMLVLLDLRYGSEEGNKFIDKLYRFISKSAYEASVMLAVEKGAFPACEPNKHIESGFMKRMTSKIRALVQENGIRNCAILTIAPTGTTSILSDNCSAGIEPMFAAAYERRYWKNNKRAVETVFHPLFSKFLEEGKDVSKFVGSHDLLVKEHMEVQKIVQKHIDNAVSKTINMPEDYSIDEMSDLWLEYLPHLKGTTFYRTNSRGYVDEAGVVHEPPLVALSLEDAKKKFNETVEHYIGSEEHCGFKDEPMPTMECPSGVCSL